MGNPIKSVQMRIPAIALLMLPATTFLQAQQPAQKPNFILILTDDQGWTSSSQQMDNHMANSKSDFYETPNME